MANEKEIFGLPKVDINFKTQATTAIARSSRGIGVLILNDENAFDDNGNEEIKYFKIESTTDIPDSGINEKNIDLIKKALLGTPLRLHVYLIPPETYNVTSSGTTVTSSATTTQADVLKKIADVKFNYIAHSTGKSQDQQDLASWVKSQRQNKKKTFKAVVANYDADSYSVINFTTEKIRVENPAYVDALKEVDGDAALVPSTIPQYLTYSATEYTARILGILAGLPLDRSATFFILSEVVDVAEYDDIDVHISGGELCLFDAKDDNGVKIARACNSLHTFTTDVGEDFRFIKIIEAIDLITDDIRDTFNDSYVGKMINDFEHKMLFIAAINIYLKNLRGNVLDSSLTVRQEVEIDSEKNKDYAQLHGRDVKNMTPQEILETNTGTHV
ncbi:MAG: phage tail sheath protein, partial [Selenomonadaceae bacterium]|nr:phage tail sheath protein [Selenomonadaceae bacterium]